MWEKILGFISNPLTTWIEKNESRKYMKEEGNLEITKAKVAFKVAQYESQAQRLLRNDIADSDYDLAAQQNKRYTIVDELLVACTILLVAAHFFFPEIMEAGWTAMGYESTPWWLEFIIVGIFVSVFGLMRLFRAFNPFNKEGKKKD